MSARLTSAHFQPGHAGPPGWTRQQLPADLGRCFVDRLQIEPGIALIYSEYVPSRDLDEASRIDHGTRVLTLTLGLEGRSGYEAGRGGDLLGFHAGHTTLSLSGRATGHRRYAGDARVRQLRLAVDEPAMRRYGLRTPGDVDTRVHCVRQLAFGRTRADVARFGQVLDAAHAGRPIGRLDLQIAALSLLSAQLAQDCPGPGGRDDDEARLFRARALLEDNYDQALTVAWLCRTTGLNECKLKQGFRSLFGTSPYRMLTAIRMRHARDMLARGQSVATTAYRTGYQHPSSFSAAFCRHHGHPPSYYGGRAAHCRTLAGNGGTAP
ncbi:helix-turn-helix domain-containing protein [Stenotrophomonas mori]|uniref:AraC family transcriptional regulator n=1 Tax=Stenotrophomonas mori TaxID=2871096 RepID=A0ABT0SJQ4_9GAMM|nr:AraC family transcriptional regulator [Stenotrophomonas mori]MCL7715326.1 AraC family transcriptional regulator [Stenotrophomonas mori]